MTKEEVLHKKRIIIFEALIMEFTDNMFNSKLDIDKELDKFIQSKQVK